MPEQIDDSSANRLRHPVEGALTLSARHLSVVVDGVERYFHYMWLRDNSWAPEDRIGQTGERRLFTAHIDPDIAPKVASYDTHTGLSVVWTDGGASTYSPQWLRRYDYSDEARAGRQYRPTLWDEQPTSPRRFGHADVVGNPQAQLAYLDAVREFGAAIVTNVPAVDGESARFAETIGHVREIAFERVHNVRTDPTGYSIAHTPMELKPHTDMPSYAWPPSIQLLHFLTNQATGGETTLTDGWAALAELRREHPQHFDTLVRTPVPFQVFSDEEDTATEAPLIQLDTERQVRLLRFSNHLAQPLSIRFEQVEAFYDAYCALGRIIDSGRYRVTLKAQNGDLITVHGHRVLHGRLPYDPESGTRHIQDVYMEFDDLTARARVLRGDHKPLPAEASGHLAR
jgi:gamma-butyrobetaine dioxygenase